MSLHQAYADFLSELRDTSNEVQSLRSQLAAVEAERDRWRAKWEDLEMNRASCCMAMEKERDALKAENERLREALESVERIAGDGIPLTSISRGVIVDLVRAALAHQPKEDADGA